MRRLPRVLLLLLCCAIAAPATPAISQSEAAAAQQKKKNEKRRKTANRKRVKRRKPAARRKKTNRKRRPARRKKRAARKKAVRKRTAKKRAKARKPGARKPADNTAGKNGNTVRTVIHDWKDAQKLIAKHKGKVVVVDFWATWCGPCVKELPNLVALQKQYPKDVVAISFSTDTDGIDDLQKDIVPRVQKVLKKLNATNVTNIISKQTDEEVNKAAGITSVPTIFVYGRDGKLAKKIDVNSAGGKDVSYEKHVVPLVKELIAKKTD